MANSINFLKRCILFVDRRERNPRQKSRPTESFLLHGNNAYKTVSEFSPVVNPRRMIENPYSKSYIRDDELTTILL